jgi:hypothetical protein
MSRSARRCTKQQANDIGEMPENGRKWRRGRDSNPRYAFDVYSLSRGAPSTTRPPLRCGGDIGVWSGDQDVFWMFRHFRASGAMMDGWPGPGSGPGFAPGFGPGVGLGVGPGRRSADLWCGRTSKAGRTRIVSGALLRVGGYRPPGSSGSACPVRRPVPPERGEMPARTVLIYIGVKTRPGARGRNSRLSGPNPRLRQAESLRRRQGPNACRFD